MVFNKILSCRLHKNKQYNLQSYFEDFLNNERLRKSCSTKTNKLINYFNFFKQKINKLIYL